MEKLKDEYLRSQQILMPCGDTALQNNTIIYAKKAALHSRCRQNIVRTEAGTYDFREDEYIGESETFIGCTMLNEHGTAVFILAESEK